MKKLSRKWLILEHYIQTAELVIEGVTLRVWKPKTMGKLPAYRLKEALTYDYQDFIRYMRFEDKAKWVTRNHDYGMWDIQSTLRYDPHRKVLDVYICSLLVVPFSREAQIHYEERMGLDPMDRLLLMWDSRQFDTEGKYPVAPNGKVDFEDSGNTYEDLYRVLNKNMDLEDTSK